MVYRITGRFFSSPIKVRAFWCAHGVVSVIDGILELLLLGLAYSDFAEILVDLAISHKLISKARFGTNIGHVGDLPVLVERAYWWVHAWANLIDGLIESLSLGFFSGSFGSRLSGWRIQRRLDMYESPAPNPAQGGIF